MVTRLEDVPADLVVDYDIRDASLAENVQEVLSRIRSKAPITYSPAHSGYWVVTGYDEAYEVLRQPEIFSNEGIAVPRDMGQTSKIIPGQIDPPEHTGYRQILGPLFSPVRANALEGDMRQLANELIDGFADRGSCELISEFAHPLPANLFLAQMGWPLHDAPLFTQWTHTLLIGIPGASDEENLAVKGKAAQEVFQYFGAVVADRRTNPTDDFTTALVQARFNGERPLSEDELLHLIFELMLGGLHTVRGTIGFSILNLCHRPEDKARLIEHPEVIPSAVEEMLRYDSVVSVGRLVMKPIDIGGVHMDEGDTVLVSLWAINRDGAVFPDPDTLVVDRNPNKHLAFSAGPHRCVGSHLARVELKVAFEELHRRIPGYRLDPDRPPVLAHSQLRSVEELHLLFTPEKDRRA